MLAITWSRHGATGEIWPRLTIGTDCLCHRPNSACCSNLSALMTIMIDVPGGNLSALMTIMIDVPGRRRRPTDHNNHIIII